MPMYDEAMDRLEFCGDFDYLGDHPRRDVALALHLTSNELTIVVAPNALFATSTTSPCWSHTGYELQNLSVGLNYLLGDEAYPHIEVPTPQQLYGPSMGLRRALAFELGHPGISKAGIRTNVFAECVWAGRDPRQVDVTVVQGQLAVSVRSNFDEVQRFAEKCLDLATKIATCTE